MPNSQLLDYIGQQLKQGINKEEIKKSLIANGWQEQDVEEAFSLISTTAAQPPQSPLPPIAPFSTTQQIISTLPSAPKILKEAWAIYKARFGTFMGIGIIPALVVGAIIALLTAGEFLTSKFTPSTSNLGALIALAAVSLGGAAIVFLLYFWSQAALAYAVKDYQEKIGVKEAYKMGWHKILSYWWVSILMGFVIMGGFLLLFIPGIIFAVWFSLSIFILIAEDQKGMSALLKSKEYVKGKWRGVLWRLLFMAILLLIVSSVIVGPFVIFKIPYGKDIASFIASLFIAPLSFSYLFLVYQHLKNLKGEVSFTPTVGKKTLFIFISVLGFLLLPVFIAAMIFSGLYWNKDKAYDAHRKSDISQIQLSLEMYYDKYNSYPSALTALAPEYLPEIPADPKTNKSYEYQVQPDNTTYQLCATLSDKTKKCAADKENSPNTTPNMPSITPNGTNVLEKQNLQETKNTYENYFDKNTPSGRDNLRDIDLATITSALMRYYKNKASFPDKLEDMVPQYSKNIPTDPKTGLPYDYQVRQNGKGFELCVNMETQTEVRQCAYYPSK